MSPAETADASLLERAPVMLRDALTGFLPEPARWAANSLICIIAILAVFGLLFASSRWPSGRSSAASRTARAPTAPAGSASFSPLPTASRC